MKIKRQLKARALLLVLMSLFLLTGRANAQTVQVTLKIADKPLEHVLEAIEQQTNYLFVYDKNVDVTRKVTINVDKTPLKNVLDQLFKSTNIIYAVENTSIVLSVSTGKTTGNTVVKGVVTDMAGSPVIGAAVMVKGTTNGTTTGLNGDFSLTVPNPVANKVFVVNYLGYETKEVVIGNRTVVNIQVKESNLMMDDIVVTALGIKRSEKALSYNVQQVASDDIVTVKDVNFVNALSGKVAGININSSSSGVGGASKVVMRGTKGIDQSSNALYVIDGIPMYNMTKETKTGFASEGSTEAIADINPEDIESISVLTGAAAAALYGSNASNGAIVINTKKGVEGKTVVTVSSNTEILNAFILPQFQNRYGTGDLSSSVDVPEKSWGHLLNSSNYTGYDPGKDYFQTGYVATESVSLSTGNDKNQTYISASAVNSEGIVPNNGYDRYNFTFRNTSSFLKDKMKLDVGASYIQQQDLNMTNQGVYSNPLQSAYLFPRSNDWSDIKMFERYDVGRKISTQYWPSGEGTYVMQNPYWVNYRNLRQNNRDRYTMNAGLSYQILDWLSVSGRIRIDNANNEFTEKLYASTNTNLTEGSQNGLYGIRNTKDKQAYGDFLINVNKTFNDWSLQANVGGSFSNLRQDELQNRGPIADGSIAGETAGIPNLFNVYQLSTSKTVREQTGWREQVQSIFASVEVGYKNTYYLTLTGRNDWPSQLAGPQSVKSSFFYPSVGGTVVLSEIISLPEQISYLKLRGSFASVGLPFKRFYSNPTYAWDNTNKVWVTSTRNPHYMLKPERTDSWEAGITMRFLKYFSLDASYYNTKTYNQTFDPQLSSSTGHASDYVQSGSVLNRGVEANLSFRKEWNRFTWSSTVTMSANKNEILELIKDYRDPATGKMITQNRINIGGLGQTRFILKTGGSLGDIYSIADLKRDSNGDIYVDENGNIQALYNVDDIKLGSVFPKANLAWRNDFRYGNFSFGAMISARLGGVVFSRTQAAMDYYGVSERSAIARDNGGVAINDGGDVISAQKWFSTIGGQDGIPQHYTYSATNVRLQEASIGYTIPRKKLGDLFDLTVSLVGRNLWMIYNKAPFDPESVASTGNYYQGIDYFMTPNTRNIGFNVRLKF